MQDVEVFPDLEEVEVHHVVPHLGVLVDLLVVHQRAILDVHHPDDHLGEDLVIEKKGAYLAVHPERVEI